MSTPQINSSEANNFSKALNSQRTFWATKKQTTKLGASLNESEMELIPHPLGTIKRELYTQWEKVAQNRWKAISEADMAQVW